jgi:hypothetical protein
MHPENVTWADIDVEGAAVTALTLLAHRPSPGPPFSPGSQIRISSLADLAKLSAMTSRAAAAAALAAASAPAEGAEGVAEGGAAAAGEGAAAASAGTAVDHGDEDSSVSLTIFYAQMPHPRQFLTLSGTFLPAEAADVPMRRPPRAYQSQCTHQSSQVRGFARGPRP